MKPTFTRALGALLLVAALGVAAVTIPDWTDPLPCKRVGDRMIC